MKFVAASVGKAEENNEYAAADRVLTKLFPWHCVENRIGENPVNQTVKKLIDVWDIGQDNRVPWLVGEKEDGAHDKQHGDESVPRMRRRHSSR